MTIVGRNTSAHLFDTSFNTNGPLYSAASGVITSTTSANNSVLLTDGSGLPSLGTTLANSFSFAASSSGATVSTTVSNTSNTASSNALQQITVAGTSAGDAFTTYTVTGTTNWSVGTDNSVTGDPFVIAASTALGTTNIMSAVTTGEINYPLQPAFLAYQASQASNATGDSTIYTLGTTVDLTEVFDQNSDFDPTSGTFTAPVTGRYALETQIMVLGATAITEMEVGIITGNRNYRKRVNFAAAAAIPAFTTVCYALADMDAADTATFYVYTADTGGKIDDVFGEADSRTFCCGNLEC